MKSRDFKKEVILFIHGFGSSSKSWDPLINLLNEDDAITTRYNFATWDYPTKWINMNILGRIPRLKELVRALENEIDSPQYRDRTLTLVGHSQGGLVIQSYFESLLERGEASILRQIRQAIFFATPSEGSNKIMKLRLLLSTFFRNPQEMNLRVLNPDVADLRRTIRRRIVNASDDTKNQWRLPIHSICAMEDNIVTETSCRGPFDSVKSVHGNHFSIIKPDDHNDNRYSEFVEFLLDPGGHKNLFEIETYQTVIEVEPRKKDIIKTGGNFSREVEYDNYAKILRSVRFATSNRCKKRFTISYGTRRNGYVIGHMSHDNEAPARESGIGEDYGTYIHFEFTPESDKEYSLMVEIFNGFDENNRDVHFHLNNNSYYRYMLYVLDLTAYVAAGFEINQEPSLYLYPKDVKHGNICSNRILNNPIKPIFKNSQGLYYWEIRDIKQGVVDIKWDVKKESTVETYIELES